MVVVWLHVARANSRGEAVRWRVPCESVTCSHSEGTSTTSGQGCLVRTVYFAIPDLTKPLSASRRRLQAVVRKVGGRHPFFLHINEAVLQWSHSWAEQGVRRHSVVSVQVLEGGRFVHPCVLAVQHRNSGEASTMRLGMRTTPTALRRTLHALPRNPLVTKVVFGRNGIHATLLDPLFVAFPELCVVDMANSWGCLCGGCRSWCCSRCSPSDSRTAYIDTVCTAISRLQERGRSSFVVVQVTDIDDAEALAGRLHELHPFPDVRMKLVLMDRSGKNLRLSTVVGSRQHFEALGFPMMGNVVGALSPAADHQPVEGTPWMGLLRSVQCEASTISYYTLRIRVEQMRRSNVFSIIGCSLRPGALHRIAHWLRECGMHFSVYDLGDNTIDLPSIVHLASTFTSRTELVDLRGCRVLVQGDDHNEYALCVAEVAQALRLQAGGTVSASVLSPSDAADVIDALLTLPVAGNPVLVRLHAHHGFAGEVAVDDALVERDINVEVVGTGRCDAQGCIKVPPVPNSSACGAVAINIDCSALSRDDVLATVDFVTGAGSLERVELRNIPSPPGPAVAILEAIHSNPFVTRLLAFPSAALIAALETVPAVTPRGGGIAQLVLADAFDHTTALPNPTLLRFALEALRVHDVVYTTWGEVDEALECVGRSIPSGVTATVISRASGMGMVYSGGQWSQLSAGAVKCPSGHAMMQTSINPILSFSLICLCDMCGSFTTPNSVRCEECDYDLCYPCSLLAWCTRPTQHHSPLWPPLLHHHPLPRWAASAEPSETSQNPLSDINPSEIGDYFVKAGVPLDVADALKREGIDGSTVFLLTDSILKNELNIQSSSHRNAVLRAQQSLLDSLAL
eukprot:Sspe_Gene.21655::Locus_8132_Transcript_1_1_Confidence_1.000_Length_2623::g.21655::m.21655